MEKVIITGPTGAIGIALIKKLIAEETFVIAVCHKGTSRIGNIPKSEYVDIVECDLEEIIRLPQLLNCNEKYGCFVHLAWAGTAGDARNDAGLQIKNIQYTIDAVEAAAELGCERFVGAGSQAEYGRFEGILKPDTATFPENGYGIAKLCAGQLSRIRCEQLELDHIWTRILSVYGPCDGENTLISSLVKKLRNGDRVSCTKAEQIWDYIYSEDAADAMIKLMQHGKNGKTYLVASGESRQLKEYIEIVKGCIDPRADIGYGEIPYSDKQVMNLRADISDLISDTGFSPRYGFEEGISKLLKWHQEGKI